MENPNGGKKEKKMDSDVSGRRLSTCFVPLNTIYKAKYEPSLDLPLTQHSSHSHASSTPEVTGWQPAGQSWLKGTFCLALKS